MQVSVLSELLFTLQDVKKLEMQEPGYKGARTWYKAGNVSTITEHETIIGP